MECRTTRPSSRTRTCSTKTPVRFLRWPSLALFCDINLEPETVQQCLGFCRLTSPDAPGDAVARLDADEYARAAVSKAKGYAALFVAQDFVAAATEYEGALCAYV